MKYIICFIFSTVLGFYSDELDIHKILYKRDALDNLVKDEPTSSCRNGGILSHGECHCPFPHTGTRCQDFDCQNGGISVGKRYDPNSFLFSKPCLCQNGFNGDMCQYRLENKCSGKGEWKNGRCKCIEFFFGNYCQFSTHCVFGKIKHGRCICHRGYEGNYCHKIVCYHGYPNARNQSQSCICPAKYKGLHCDGCAQIGPHIAPYPIYSKTLNRDYIKVCHYKRFQAMSRFTMMAICGIFLLVILLVMLAIQIYNKKKKNPEAEEIRMREWDERKRMLAEAAVKSEQEPEEPKTRKISFANIFKRRQSTDVRKTSVFQRFKRQQSSPDGFREELSFSTLT